VPVGVSPAARARSLAQLEACSQAGRFPLHGVRGRHRPVFVDHRGTHCAVGHLLAPNGHTGLVRRIAAERNHAYVPELAPTPGLLPALSTLGLTAREAALIQPTYGGPGEVVVEPPSQGWLSPLVMWGALALAAAAVLLALGLLASTRIRRACWNSGFGRRLATTLLLVVGFGIIAYAIALFDEF
jgi:hypothetical protein